MVQVFASLFILLFLFIYHLVSIYKRYNLDKTRIFSYSDKNKLWLKAKGRCELCSTKLVPYAGSDNSAEYDHKLAYSRGGRTKLSNGSCTCRGCNRSKGSG